jgi:hypothetical protein
MTDVSVGHTDYLNAYHNNNNADTEAKAVIGAFLELELLSRCDGIIMAHYSGFSLVAASQGMLRSGKNDEKFVCYE